MKEARARSEAGAHVSDDAHTQGGLRKRLSPDEASQGDPHLQRPSTRGPPPGLVFDDDDVHRTGASHVSPYHPHYNRPRSDSLSAGSVSSAEEAGVVDAGCFPPGTIPGTGKRPGDKRQEEEEAEEEWVDDDDDSGAWVGDEPEEHEILEAKEARRWGFRSGEVFPRLFAEDSASEDSQSDSGGSEGDGASTDEEERYRLQQQHQQQRVASGSGPSGGPAGRLPQLRSRVRRGSEGYEVRPMMYDHAYARHREDEEERLREYLMRERERLGTGVRDWREWHVEGGALGQEEIEMSTGVAAGRPLLPSEIMARRAQEVVVDPGWGRGDPDEVQDDGDDGDDYGDYGARPEDRG
jgi:hypothetical protein